MTKTKTVYSIPVTEVMNEVRPQKFRLNSAKRPHFCPPGVGHWGMAKMAFLVPEITVVFVIPMGCGRHGAIAAMMESDDTELYYLPIAEVDIVTGNHLDKTEAALTELIEENAPKGIMLFTTCIDDLLGSDYDSVMHRVEKKFGTPIVRAKMNPLLSLSKKPPAMMIYHSIHGFLKKCAPEKGLFNIVGTPCPIDPDSEIHTIFQKLALPSLQHIGNYTRFEDHFDMAKAEGNLLIGIAGTRAVEDMKKRLGQPFLPMYSVFRPEGIRENYQKLSEFIGKEIETEPYETELLHFIEEIRPGLEGKTAVIGAQPQIAPFELARFLTEIGIEVRYINAGFIKPYERDHLPWLEEHAAQIQVIPSVEPSLSSVRNGIEEIDFGIGLDTPAYFSVNHLIDISVEKSLFGYTGTRQLLEEMLNAEKYTMTIKELVYSQNLVT